MTRWLALAALLLLNPALAQDGSSSPAERRAKLPAKLRPLVAGNSRFACDLYAQLLQGETGNLFLSPYSVSTALAMTYAGARGSTAQQMGQGLRFPLEPKALHPAFGRLVDHQARSRGCRLKVANALWGQAGFAFQPEFRRTTESAYRASFRTVPFRDAPDQARRTINTWVEERTEGLIKDLLPQGSIKPTARLVLTNAIYFKGSWQHPFPAEDTREEAFFVGGTEPRQVPFMNVEEEFRFAELEEARLVELPYEGEELSMVVIVPNAKDGLPRLEAALTHESLAGWIGQTYPRDVNLSFPRFEISWGSKSLKPALAALGMRDMFDSVAADFSGISNEAQLFVHDVFHKAFVTVNEEGTEAAAATGVVVGIESVPPPPIELKADRPFLFVIRDRLSGSILFMGRVNDPS